MNDDTLYSIAITEAEKGYVRFSIPDVDVYMSVQVTNEGGHGQYYVVGKGDYNLPIETRFAMLVFRSGTEKGIEAATRAQDKIKTDMFKFGSYKLPNYNYDEVEAWTTRLTAETQGSTFEYTFPSTSADIKDLHHWNLENANGWGGATPVVNVSNKYTNSVLLSGKKCLITTFEDPKSKYFTSFTAYDKDRYLMEGVKNINSYRWKKNKDGTVTISFNCGKDAINNIDTKGQDFSFTVRYYGVSQKVLDGKIEPEKTVK